MNDVLFVFAVYYKVIHILDFSCIEFLLDNVRAGRGTGRTGPAGRPNLSGPRPG
jgi:hypothetical protein